MSTTTPHHRAPNRTYAKTDEVVWRERMMIGLGLVGILAVLAIIVSVAALSSSSNAGTSGAAASATAGGSNAAAAPVAPAVKPQSITLAVKADDEHGKLGQDGKWHDAFLPANFTVHAGATVTVTVINYDGGMHSFTSPSMNVNQVIPGGGSLTAPHTTTFTFTAPKKAGAYQWWCSVPCDPYAMKHNGYMRGVVTVSA